MKAAVHRSGLRSHKFLDLRERGPKVRPHLYQITCKRIVWFNATSRFSVDFPSFIRDNEWKICKELSRSESCTGQLFSKRRDYGALATCTKT
jgi:hypothetical protein